MRSALPLGGIAARRHVLTPRREISKPVLGPSVLPRWYVVIAFTVTSQRKVIQNLFTDRGRGVYRG